MRAATAPRGRFEGLEEFPIAIGTAACCRTPAPACTDPA